MTMRILWILHLAAGFSWQHSSAIILKFSKKKGGKLTADFYASLIFWPSKIKIVCLSRVNDFYDNHRFMFSAVYIRGMRSHACVKSEREEHGKGMQAIS